MYDPEVYDAWYTQGHGKWIGDVEYSLIIKLLEPSIGETLLDVGCGTGYFSRRFKKSGVYVTGLEPDAQMLDFARASDDEINWVKGSAEQLPFDTESFDYVTAITSLCFIRNPQQALHEMLRVSKKAVVLGLLNKHSLLYRQKYNKGMYAGARWDNCSSVNQWLAELEIKPMRTICRSAIYLPGGQLFARNIETIIPSRLLLGGFLAIKIKK